jgi:hypothetical protein
VAIRRVTVFDSLQLLTFRGYGVPDPSETLMMRGTRCRDTDTSAYSLCRAE